MSQYGRGFRTSIPTPAIATHKQAVQASVKRRESYRQGKREREEESEPDWSAEEDNGRSRSQHDYGNGHLDDLALDLMADEAKRQALIRTIQERDQRDDHFNMDEDELQRIWDEGEARRKAKARADTLFSKGSRVIDNGPARLAMSPEPTSKQSTQSDKSRKRASSPSGDSGPGKRARGSDNRTIRKTHLSPRRSQPFHQSCRQKNFVPRSPTSSSTRSGSFTRERMASSTSSAHSGQHNGSRSSKRYPSSRSSSRAPSPTSKSQRRTDCDGTEDRREQQVDEESDVGFDDEAGSDEDSREQSNKDKGKSKKKRKSDRGRSGEFEGVERDLVDATVELLCATLACRGMFPDAQQYTRWIVRSWKLSTDNLRLSREEFTLTKRHTQAIRDRVNSFRGRLRDRVKGVFNQRFDFRGRTMTAKEIERKVAEMLPYTFHRKEGATDGTGWFEHPMLQRMVCEAFFTGRSPLGVNYPELFDPFPSKGVSLLCAMVVFLFGEWKTGKYKKQRMTLDLLKPIYERQQRMMAKFRDKQPEPADVLFASLYKDSMSDVGATVPIADESSEEHEEDLDALFAKDGRSSQEDLGSATPSSVRRRQSPQCKSSRQAGPTTPSGDQHSRVNDNSVRKLAEVDKGWFASGRPTPVPGIGVLLRTPATGAPRSRIEVVISAPPSSSLRKKGPSAARSAGKLKILGSQRQT